MSLSRTAGWVQLGFALKVVVLYAGGLPKKVQVFSSSVFIVCGFVNQLYSPSNLCVCVCVECGHIVCIHKAHFPSLPCSTHLFSLHCTLVCMVVLL